MRKLMPADHLTMSGPATYRIIVQGELEFDMGARFAGMSVSRRENEDGDIESILVG